MAYAQRSGTGGAVLKWKDQPVGFVLEGKNLGIRNGKVFQGKQSRLIVIQKADGSQITAPANSVVENNLLPTDVGKLVRITHLGMARGQSGVEYRNFKIEVDETSDAGAAGAAQTAAAPTAIPASGVATLEQKLIDSQGPQAAQLMLNALMAKYVDPVIYESKVRELLISRGVQV